MQDRKTLVVIIVVVVGILGLGILLYLSVRPEPPIKGLIQFPRPQRGHDNTIEYPYDEFTLPPPGGLHWDIWQNCGVYTEAVKTEHAVHVLEHGAVWISYQSDLPADQVTALQDRVVDETFLLLAPYPTLESPVVLSAWGVQLAVDDANDGRIDRFISKYRLGSQTPEPGATCDRGVGQPIDREVTIGREAMDFPESP